MDVCIFSLNGEQLAVGGLEDASTVAEVRVLTAAALGCSASSLKLVLSHEGDLTSPC